jgi:toxin ParE1/3/4
VRLELSRKAQSDLDDIRDFSVLHFGVDRAVAYLDAFEATFRRILDFSEIGAPHSALTPAARAIGCQRHRIYYDHSYPASGNGCDAVDLDWKGGRNRYANFDWRHGHS